VKEILDEQTIYEQGSFRQVRRWYRGRHPELGRLIQPEKTLSGDWETVAEETVIRPTKTFTVSSDGKDE